MSIEASDSSIPPSPSNGAGYLLRLWFGVSEPVLQKAYIISGCSLMVLKYSVEALLVWLATSNFYTPLDFLNPSMGGRSLILRGAPEWLPWAIFLWTLPFLWIATSMSVRRAADAGNSPWIGLMVLIPVLNFMVMFCLCAIPSAGVKNPLSLSAGRVRDPNLAIDVDVSRSQKPDSNSVPRVAESPGTGAAPAIGLSLLIGGMMLFVSVYLFSTYGTSLFLGTPMLMGTTASYLYNRRQPRGVGASVGVGLASVFFAMCALLLFALEGAICVAMAAPLVLPIGAIGGLVGKAIADATRRPPTEFIGALLVLPLWAGCEALWMKSTEFVVLSTVDIEAPPETVWNNVVDFPELTEPKPWYFKLGISCPLRARIDGSGPGAIRYCEFTTGAFVEPITAWEQPERLAFNVAQQPDPMVELSPYRNIRPPHMNHYLRSTHGEFRLIALPNGGTRLEGRTWYQFDMFPQAYWTLWSDMFIHRIHQRVLLHIKSLAESSSPEAIHASP